MINEIDLMGTSAQVGPQERVIHTTHTVMVYDAGLDNTKNSPGNTDISQTISPPETPSLPLNTTNLDSVKEAIARDEGAVLYIGEGSASTVEADLKALPPGTEIVGVKNGTSSPMRVAWQSIDRSDLTYLYADSNHPPKDGSFKYVILQDLQNLDLSAGVINDIYFRALEALQSGGILFQRNDQGEWETLRKKYEDGRPIFVKDQIIF